jgi:hypothetical protein
MKSLAEIESQIKIKNTSDKSTKTWHELSMLLDLQKQLTVLREAKEKDRKQKLRLTDSRGIKTNIRRVV